MKRKILGYHFCLLTVFLVGNNSLKAQDDNDSKMEIRVENFIEHSGDLLMFGLPAVAGSATLFLEDKKGSRQFVRSFICNTVITHSLKYTIDKPRPEGATDGLAFPSGHTSTSFHAASFIQRRYGWKYGGPAYILAGFVAYSRLEADRHDGWDVLGGIAIGIGSTYLLTSSVGEDIDIGIASDGQGLALKYRF